MLKKSFIIILLLIFIILFAFIAILLFLINSDHKNKKISIYAPPAAIVPGIAPTNSQFLTVDSSFAPYVTNAVFNGEIFLQMSHSQNHIWQQFLLENNATGSQSSLFEFQNLNATFEKILTKNWSPTNEYLYVIIDYSNGQKNLLLLKTVNTFRHTSFYTDESYAQPIMLTSGETVANPQWVNDTTLDFEKIYRTDNTVQNYEVDFNDNTLQVYPLGSLPTAD